MAHLRFTTDAYHDLDEIVRYVAVRNPFAAVRLTDRIEAECWRLARHPGTGQPRPDLAPGLRFFPVARYFIFYRESVDGIHVIRIIHGSRRLRPSGLHRLGIVLKKIRGPSCSPLAA